MQRGSEVFIFCKCAGLTLTNYSFFTCIRQCDWFRTEQNVISTWIRKRATNKNICGGWHGKLKKKVTMKKNFTFCKTFYWRDFHDYSYNLPMKLKFISYRFFRRKTKENWEGTDFYIMSPRMDNRAKKNICKFSILQDHVHSAQLSSRQFTCLLIYNEENKRNLKQEYLL